MKNKLDLSEKLKKMINKFKQPLIGTLLMTSGFLGNGHWVYSQGGTPGETPSPEENSVSVVLVENTDLDSSSHRLHFPLLITKGKGFRIKCQTQADEEKVIRGLGFVSMPSTVMDALSDTVMNARPEDQPLLCPHATNYKIKLYRHNPGTGEQFYLHFPTNFNERSYGDALYVAGCSGILEGLKLNVSQAIAADPTPFFPESIYKIDCVSGAPITAVPKTFNEWCMKKDLTPDQLKTVNALLNYTPVGSAALNNDLKCKEAETFLNSLTAMNLGHQQLVDLQPLSSIKNLTQLILSNNKIVDLGPLSGLRALTMLNLGQNKIQNVSSLAGLIQLTDLNLSGNLIVDVRPLSSIASLKKLNLSSNGLIDLSLPSVSYLTSLKELNLSKNRIVNPSPLSELSSLEKLDLSYNQIDSISSLSELKTTVNILLEGNPLNTDTFEEFCAVRRSESNSIGHTVRELIAASKETSCHGAASVLDSAALLNLEGKGIVDITPLKFFTNLRELNLAKNSIENLSTLSGLTQLNRVFLSQNNIRNVDPLLPLLSLTELEVKGNPIEMKTFASWCVLKEKRDFVLENDALTVEALLNVEGRKNCVEADRHLNALLKMKIKNAGLKSLKPLSAFKQLISLDLDKNDLTDLTPLKDLNNLVHLYLSQNPNLTNLGPLSQLSKLEVLTVRQAKVKDLLPLKNLFNLKILHLDINQVETLAALSEIKGLSNLTVSQNPLQNLNSINSMTGLKELNISNTSVRYIQNLGDLPSLETVIMANVNVIYSSYNDYCLVSKFYPSLLSDKLNTIKGIEEVMAAANVDVKKCSAANEWSKTLTSLTMNSKSLSNIEPLAFFPALTGLSLYDNQISNIYPLANLGQLQFLNLTKNRVADLGGLRNLQQLKKIYLNENNIVETEPISRLPQLERLILFKNNITNPSVLGSLPQIKVLDLRENKIHSLDGISYLISVAQGRGALDPNKPVGVYLKSNTVCNYNFVYTALPGTVADRIVEGHERVNKMNQVKARACSEIPPKEFTIIDHIRPIDIRPIRVTPITPIRPIGPRPFVRPIGGIIGGNS